jgi:glycosyltransferase involved in cell wall biosynthesis
MQPKVTLGIPTFNRPIALERAVNAALRQSFPSLEIVISDNASTHPEVEPLLKRLEQNHPELKILRQARNHGAYRNCQSILEHASGEYVVFLADDDLCTSNYVQSLLECIERHPGAIALTDIKICDVETCETKLDDEVANSYHFALPIELLSGNLNARLSAYLSLKHEFAHVVYGMAPRASLLRAFNAVFDLYTHPVSMDVHIVQCLLMDHPVARAEGAHRVYVSHNANAATHHVNASNSSKTWTPALLQERFARSIKLIEQWQLDASSKTQLIELARSNCDRAMRAARMQSLRSTGVQILKRAGLHGVYRTIKSWFATR